MAIYHFSAKVISRANGSSAVAAAAYRAAERLHDERLDRAHDFTNKAGVVHSELILPIGAPERWQDRAALWNAVEAGEVRKDAQLAREVEFAIPRELTRAQGIALARDFVAREFVARGMVADLNVHWDVGPDGEPKPHAHVMLSLRSAGPEGFGAKVRDWNSTTLLSHWREAWGEHVNARLAELGIEARVDHRSFQDQGLDLEPQNKIGPAGSRRERGGEAAERAADHREIARRNGERIIAEPRLALDAITRQQSTFTDHDLARFVHRHTDDRAQFDRALAAVRASPEVVRLGRDGQGRERFSSREMIAVEQRLEASADRLGERRGHGVSAGSQGRALALSAAGGLTLSAQQQDAFFHVTGRRDLSLVVGYAGAGKSAMLGVGRQTWEAEGYRVRGGALSGMAAENLEGGSAIPSRTLASWERAWAQGRETLTARDVLVIDEAGLIGSRQMERILRSAEAAGAKVVMVGDAEQLQAIEAGAAFRALAERHGALELTEVRRQQVGWQREATRHLATERTGLALAAYAEAGMVRAHERADLARVAVVDGWDASRQAAPAKSQLMLAYTRADVAALNGLARDRMRDSGQLGEDQLVQTPRGARTFAAGDRIMFLRNERSLGVKNGTLGRVEAVRGGALAVRLDDGRSVGVELKTYADLDHGYATTIHKSQGVTVDRVHVLASGHMDRHAAYVALSRHRERVDLHYSRETFADPAALARGLGRDRSKDTTLDYSEPFAARRGLTREAPARRGGLFARFQPRAGGVQARAVRDVGPLVRDYARAHRDAARMGDLSLPVLPHQQRALERTERALDREKPGLAGAVRATLESEPSLIERAARGRTGEVTRRAEQALTSGGVASTQARKVELDHGRSQAQDLPPLIRHADLDRGFDR